MQRRSGSPPDQADACVGDTSFWINLAATGFAETYLRANTATMLITDVAVGELERGRAKGRLAAEQIRSLVAMRLVEVVQCKDEDEELYMSLVAGSAAETLEDGEAATLVYAASVRSAAIIDERKATKLAAVKFPELLVLTTVDLLLAPNSIKALGRSTTADAIFNSLSLARMRVPEHQLQKVADLIGPERVRLCPSLPGKLRLGGPVGANTPSG